MSEMNPKKPVEKGAADDLPTVDDVQPATPTGREKPAVDKISSVEDRSLPIFSEVEKVFEQIRDRAYELFASRNFGLGFDLDDWLKAEKEAGWPAAELVEDDDVFELKVALAGFDAEDISVTANPKELIIKASRETEAKTAEKSADEAPAKDEGTTVHFTEFHKSDVFRHVGLPADIDVDKVKAKFLNGMLEIQAPKAAAAEQKPKAVDISTAA